MKINVLTLIGIVTIFLLSACAEQANVASLRKIDDQKQYSDPLKFQRAYHHEDQAFPYPVQPSLMQGYDPVLKVKHSLFPVKK